MEALVRAGAGFWTRPHGEPEWIKVPAGEFWMGSDRGIDDERPPHKLHLDDYLISRTPISNAQYHLFTQDAEYAPPQHWAEDRPPKGLESHPVVYVNWHDALAYCEWLSQQTSKSITLPSEAQWERAARGDRDRREYPWGDHFEVTRCNSAELGLGNTTPVGIFPDGASPYACLDMAGNVWEWTCSLWGEDVEKPEYDYPYDSTDGREALDAPDNVLRVLRGGAFYDLRYDLRCACRGYHSPNYGDLYVGFRVVLSPFFSDP
jgi:formylglycine-generating enzyme required for sulfatase activity